MPRLITETKPVKVARHRMFDRLYVVGDVHGMHEHLVALLAAIEADAKTFDGAVAAAFVGDFVDRGQDSAKCVKTAREWAPPFPAFHVLGNHELMMGWDAESGSWHYPETLESYVREGDHPARMVADIKWFESLPHVLEFGGKVIVVHAGLSQSRDEHGGWSGEAQSLEETMIHTAVWIRPHENGFASYLPGKLVVHGHSPYDTMVVPEGDAVNVDTGCFHTGRLSAAVIDSKPSMLKAIHVDAKVSYVVDEHSTRKYVFVGPDIRVVESFPH